MYYTLFPRTKVDSGQALSPARMVLLAVGQEECPERCDGLRPCCPQCSVGSVSLHPGTCWYKSSHSCGLVGGILQFLRFPNTYQILRPWELPANLCPYFGGAGVCKAGSLLFVPYRTFMVKANGFVLEKLNVKSLQQCWTESCDGNKTIIKCSCRANLRLSFLHR